MSPRPKLLKLSLISCWVCRRCVQPLSSELRLHTGEGTGEGNDMISAKAYKSQKLTSSDSLIDIPNRTFLAELNCEVFRRAIWEEADTNCFNGILV